MWGKGKMLLAAVGSSVLGSSWCLSSATCSEADVLKKPPYPPMPHCVGSQCPVTSWDDNWDLQQATAGTCDPNIEKNILLIRHGQYNIQGKSEEEKKLTKLGQEQMMVVAHRLASLKLPYSYVMGSDSTRGKESYAILGQHLGVQSGFNESLNEGFPAAPIPGPANIVGDDTYHKDVMKMEYAFRSMFKRPGASAKNSTYEILVCPSNLIRYFICRALQFPPEGWQRFEIPHGSLTWISIYKDGGVFVRTIGDVGFMPPKMVTF